MFITACVNQTCEEARPETVLNIAFRKYTNATRTARQAKDTLINITRAYAEGLESESFLTPINPDSLSRTVPLRLSLTSEATTFYLEGKNTDKVPFRLSFTVTYTQQPTFVSQACGYEISYTNLAVTNVSPLLDDALVIVPTINPIRNEVHIQLFFRP
jgi:hypothetical protein